MKTWELFVTIMCSVIASSGFWAVVQKKMDKNDVLREMLLGLAHDRIVCLGMYYIERGDWITKDEYENLNDYLYKPYVKMHGNGTGEKVMDCVKKLRTVSCPPNDDAPQHPELKVL